MEMSDHREIPVTAYPTASHNSNNPYVYISPPPPSSAATNRTNNTRETINGVLHQCGKIVDKAEVMVDNIWNHLRISPNPADAAIARVIQGTKVIAKGGSEKLFQQAFGVYPGEQLLKAYPCYISTTFGPVIGVLYISTKRLTFCSDYPLRQHPLSQHHQSIYYKVVVQLAQLAMVSPYTNSLNPREKIIQIVTVDGYEFNFMGFLTYDKALKTLNEARQLYGNHSSDTFSTTHSY